MAKIGAFLDMGLEKDLLLPFKEQTHPVRKGAVSCHPLRGQEQTSGSHHAGLFPHEQPVPYKADDWVNGTIYEINETIGAFVAVDHKYYGLIPKKELYGRFREGDTVQARVTRVREDGKLDLCVREKSYVQMGTDAEAVLKVIDDFDGVFLTTRQLRRSSCASST